MRFYLTLVIACLFPILVLAKSGDCVPAQTPSDSVPPKVGVPMPEQEGQLVTSEDRDRFEREHPDLPKAGKIPLRSSMTPDEREAVRREFQAERQRNSKGRPHEFFEPQHSTADQHRAKKLARPFELRCRSA